MIKNPGKTHPLTSGKLLTRNTILNIAGQGAPLLAGLIAVPIIINGLGIERFGVLTLTWVVIGYFGIFDLGLGRALTKSVADRLGSQKEADVPKIVWTALSMMVVFGILAAALIYFISPWLIKKVLNIPEYLQRETLVSFYLLAFSIPIVISAAGLRGLLEAYQKFGLINTVRIPLGMFNFLAPLLVIPFSNSLVPIVAVLVIGRIITWLAYFLICRRTIDRLMDTIRLDRSLIKPLASFGGWLAISNVVGPLLLYTDRFLIASLISVAAVAYYTTPYEIITKLLIIPVSLVGVLFPAFSTSFSSGNSHAGFLYSQAIKYLSLFFIPIVLIIIIFARQGLEIWLDKEFAEQSYRVAQILAIGCLMNGYGLISQSLIQSSGRPDLTAKLHLLELPLYITYLWYLTQNYGISGAASAWFIRVSISAIALFFLAKLVMRRIMR